MDHNHSAQGKLSALVGYRRIDNVNCGLESALAIGILIEGAKPAALRAQPSHTPVHFDAQSLPLCIQSASYFPAPTKQLCDRQTRRARLFESEKIYPSR